MLNKEILNQVRPGVCAIGYMTVKVQDYAKDPTRPYFKVAGTGFLVRDNVVITNRHVIESIRHAQRDTGFSDDQIRLSFVYPVRSDAWKTAYCSFRCCTTFQGADIGLVEFNRQPGEIEPCRPLRLGELTSLAVTQPIAVYGYPYGTSMLAPEGILRRFGPVLQQDYISAISPYDVSSRIDELLLDVRTAQGMSGSPVFRPEDGGVIGILYAGWEAITSVAIPIDETRIGKWLAVHDQNRAKAPQAPATGVAKVGSEGPSLPRLMVEEAPAPQPSGNGGPSGQSSGHSPGLV